MTEPERIADFYHAVSVKGAWYGPTVAELLTRIPPELAAKPPVPGANSIAALLQHLLLWNERIRHTCDGTPLPRWEAEKEWAEPPIPWDELVTRWNTSRDLLEQRLRNFPLADLQKTVPGRDYPYVSMLEGIVHHTIWHSGQIAMALGMVKRNLTP